jgi:hypothetical protein
VLLPSRVVPDTAKVAGTTGSAGTSPEAVAVWEPTLSVYVTTACSLVANGRPATSSVIVQFAVAVVEAATTVNPKLVVLVDVANAADPLKAVVSIDETVAAAPAVSLRLIWNL